MNMPTNFFLYDLEKERMLVTGALPPDTNGALGVVSESISAFWVDCAEDDTYADVSVLPRIDRRPGDVQVEEIIEDIESDPTQQRAIYLGRLAAGKTLKLLIDSDNGDVLLVLQHRPAQNAELN